MSDMKEEARACLSLMYKYDNMISCVEAQRPNLLHDPALNMIAVQIEALQGAFEDRVRDIACQHDDYQL